MREIGTETRPRGYASQARTASRPPIGNEPKRNVMPDHARLPSRVRCPAIRRSHAPPPPWEMRLDAGTGIGTGPVP